MSNSKVYVNQNSIYYDVANELSARSGSPQTPKLGWLDRWFMKMSRRAWNHQQQLERPDYPTPSLTTSPHKLDHSAELRFQVHSATGGHIVEITRVDRIKDRMDNHLYLIHDNEDFADQLSKIVMLETLKRG